MNQYNCKNNVEVSGIPEVVSGTNLENTEVIIFNVIDVKISNSDIEAVIVLAKKHVLCYFLLNRFMFSRNLILVELVVARKRMLNRVNPVSSNQLLMAFR